MIRKKIKEKEKMKEDERERQHLLNQVIEKDLFKNFDYDAYFFSFSDRNRLPKNQFDEKLLQTLGPSNFSSKVKGVQS
jgi:hypothetical protein